MVLIWLDVIFWLSVYYPEDWQNTVLIPSIRSVQWQCATRISRPPTAPLPHSWHCRPSVSGWWALEQIFYFQTARNTTCLSSIKFIIFWQKFFIVEIFSIWFREGFSPRLEVRFFLGSFCFLVLLVSYFKFRRNS